METATTLDPDVRVAFVNRKAAALIVEVLATIDTRIDDYVESGALTGRDADVMGALLERLQEDPPIDLLNGLLTANVGLPSTASRRPRRSQKLRHARRAAQARAPPEKNKDEEAPQRKETGASSLDPHPIPPPRRQVEGVSTARASQLMGRAAYKPPRRAAII